MTDPAAGALNGIRVLEFSQIVAGPIAGITLADLGADVVKVEPLGGEETRTSASVVPGESKIFQALNRGKRSLTVDLRSPDGVALIHRIVPAFDVVAINYRAGVAERLGIDYDTLRALRSDLIYWQNTGFGEDGPQVTRAGSDLVAQAYSGLMVLSGRADEEGARHLVNVPIADTASGLAAAVGICAALLHRERTGEGQYVSTSLLRTALFLQSSAVMREPVHDSVMRDPLIEELTRLRTSGGSWGEILEARRPDEAAYGGFFLYYAVYRTKDGAIALGALTASNRNAIRRVLGIEGQERSDDPDFDPADRQSAAEIARWKAELQTRFIERTSQEWVRDLDAVGTPVSAVQLPEEMADDPQVIADGMVTALTHDITGPQRVVGPIVQMSATPTAAHRASPGLGAHSTELLLELGLSGDEVEQLVDRGAIGQL